MANPRIKPPASPQHGALAMACEQALAALQMLDAGERMDYHFPLVRILQEFFEDVMATDGAKE